MIGLSISCLVSNIKFETTVSKHAVGIQFHIKPKILEIQLFTPLLNSFSKHSTLVSPQVMMLIIKRSYR